MLSRWALRFKKFSERAAIACLLSNELLANPLLESTANEPAEMSIRAMHRRTGQSDSSIRRACRTLLSNGCIRVRGSDYANGDADAWELNLHAIAADVTQA